MWDILCLLMIVAGVSVFLHARRPEAYFPAGILATVGTIMFFYMAATHDRRWSRVVSPLYSHTYSVATQEQVQTSALRLAESCAESHNLKRLRGTLVKLGDVLKTVYVHPDMTPALESPAMVEAFARCSQKIETASAEKE